jgi:hypothetical protein
MLTLEAIYLGFVHHPSSLYKNYIVLEIDSISILRLEGCEEFLSVGAVHTASLIA